MRKNMLVLGATVLGSLFALATACGGDEGEFKKSTEDAGTGATGGGGTGGGGTGGGGTGGGGTGGGGTGGAAGSDASTGGTGGTAGSDAGPDVVCTDGDNDGITDCAGDCDDADPQSYPGNPEICGDNADNDCLNGIDDTCGGIGTFVSEKTGDDVTGLGTKDKPVRTIAKGIANAQTIQQTTPGPLSVYVAEGIYSEKVKLVESVSLLGGFSCTQQPCTWQRDPSTTVSEILNQDFEGVLADNTITRATRLDGFKIVGKDGDTNGQTRGTSAVRVVGGTPSILNNTVEGGDATAGTWPVGWAFGILVLGPSNDPKGVLIQANDVQSGQSAFESAVGIAFEGSSKPGYNYGEILDNKVRGEKGKSSNGMTLWSTGTGTLVKNNDIESGEGTNTAWGLVVGGYVTVDTNRINADPSGTHKCGGTSFCGGLMSESSTSTVVNNVVYGTDSHMSAAVLLGEFEVPVGAVILSSNYLNGAGSSSSGTTSAAVVLQHGQCCGNVAIVGRINNNVLDGGSSGARYGVYEMKVSSKAAHPEMLLNNDFFIASMTAADAYYQYWDGISLLKKETTIAGVNGLSSSLPSVAANFEGDPKVDATWHLGAGSPCIDTGTATDAPAVDFEGDARPKGAAHDVGPDEAQ